MNPILINIDLKGNYKSYKKLFLKTSPEKQKKYHQEMLNTFPILKADRIKRIDQVKNKFNLDTDSLNEIADFIIQTSEDDAFMYWMKFCLELFDIYNRDPANFDLFYCASQIHEENAIQEYLA